MTHESTHIPYDNIKSTNDPKPNPHMNPKHKKQSRSQTIPKPTKPYKNPMKQTARKYESTIAYRTITNMQTITGTYSTRKPTKSFTQSNLNHYPR